MSRNILLFILSLLLIVSCSSQEKYPKDFNFTFEYGVMYKNKLDTFNQTYTKDLVMDGLITTELKLTEEEMKKIYQDMKTINIFGYPREVEGLVIVPSSGFRLKILMNGKEKNITWIGGFSEGERDPEFREFITHIIELIESKEEYQALPANNGYYE